LLWYRIIKIRDRTDLRKFIASTGDPLLRALARTAHGIFHLSMRRPVERNRGSQTYMVEYLFLLFHEIFIFLFVFVLHSILT